MNRRIKKYNNQTYHIYNRGVDKRNIFIDQTDYSRFQLLMYISNIKFRIPKQNRNKINYGQLENTDKLVDIISYTLIKNHFHILIRQKINDGISLFMAKLLTSYVMYFNKKYSRTASLCGGRYKAVHIKTDSQFITIIRYVNCNYAKLDNKNSLFAEYKLNYQKIMSKYPYSSYQDIWTNKTRNRPESYIISKKDTAYLKEFKI